ncbi:35305_t:CDS:2 [Gigaspora margarita]|uniref:Eukaryotic translation initiation factor 3 subunit M n=2 Tax=Gigaspora margarita TaxID=4874 RepID=A0A8H4EJL7_GIGMA|nr:PCI-domain-containing protein [Gigaspora margarita]CAG8802157.1 35305_t:CDS:2 [Gigaspora margarita]
MTYVNTVFTDGPLEVQVLEFASYISKLKGEPEDAGPFIKETNALLKENKLEQVFQTFVAATSILLDAPEKEFEAIYNLLIAILKSASPETYPALINNSIKALVHDEHDKAIQKLKVLQNLYNTLEYSSPLRYDVFVAILDIATKNDEIETILPQLPRLDTWVKEWSISTEQVRELYLTVSNKLKEAGEIKRSHDFLLKYLATYTSSDDLSVAKSAASRAVIEAIQLPEILSFEDLLELDTIQALKNEEVFELLKVFLSGNLKEYKQFVDTNPGAVEKLGLSNEDNTRKIRLLTLASLASEHVASEITYQTIAKALEIEEDEVEMWTIDVIRAHLIEAKVNQVRKTILVNRSTYRTFTMNQWQQLSDKLDGWKQSLADILQVIANAKLIAQHSNVNANVASSSAVVVIEGTGGQEEES